jgi:hypothetical protein
MEFSPVIGHENKVFSKIMYYCDVIKDLNWIMINRECDDPEFLEQQNKYWEDEIAHLERSIMKCVLKECISKKESYVIKDL